MFNKDNTLQHIRNIHALTGFITYAAGPTARLLTEGDSLENIELFTVLPRYQELDSTMLSPIYPNAPVLCSRSEKYDRHYYFIELPTRTGVINLFVHNENSSTVRVIPFGKVVSLFPCSLDQIAFSPDGELTSKAYSKSRKKNHITFEFSAPTKNSKNYKLVKAYQKRYPEYTIEYIEPKEVIEVKKVNERQTRDLWLDTAGSITTPTVTAPAPSQPDFYTWMAIDDIVPQTTTDSSELRNVVTGRRTH